MAIYPNDASMTDRKPDRGYQISSAPKNTSFTSKIGYEKRKKLSRRFTRTFSISYNNVHSTRKDTIEQFYQERGGDFESFTLDLTHLNLTGTINVKFSGDLQINHVISGNTLDYFDISFTLIEVP